MLWFPLALATAFLAATEAAFLKRWFNDLTAWEMTATPFLYMIPMYAATLLVVETPPLEPGFWPVIAVLLPLNVVGLVLHFRAVHESQLSLIMPFLSLTPLFVLFTAFLFLGETPKPLGLAGIALIVLGGWVLMRTPGHGAFLDPLRALARDRGALCMLAASFIYAFCAVLGKLLILKSSPLFTGNIFFLLFSLLVVGLALGSGKVRLGVMLLRPGRAAMLGGLIFLHIQCHHLSIALVDAAYMMAIKRLTGVFGVFYGWFMFRDVNIRARMLGAVIMAAGAAAIGIWG